MRWVRPLGRLCAMRFCVASVLLLSAAAPMRADVPAAMEPSEDQRIVHVLNRLGFGPRPGDVERVRKIGLDAYIRQQLAPEQIADTSVDKALEPLDSLHADSGQLIQEFYEEVKFFLGMQMAAGNGEEMKMRFGLDLPKQEKDDQKAKEAYGPQAFFKFAERSSIRNIAEFQQAKLIRATLSERQLQEVMVDFWTNHFNVDIRKNLGRAFQVQYDRDVIRKHSLGKFRDLLGGVASHPAMLHYLDNNENAVARKRSKIEQGFIEWYIGYKLGMQVAGTLPDSEGPNENFGRELLELHTLGVDGGYTQKDVQEVSRCFTGWSFSPFGGKFDFEKKRHDQGAKKVLGHDIPANGNQRDGERVLDILSKHPSTAKHISRKLCQRFVADEPPAELVDRVAKVFTETDGNIAKVVEAIVTSPEFSSPAAMRAKIKSPFEFAVSSLRATNGQFTGRGWGIFGKLSYLEEGGALIGNDPKLSKAKTKTLNWHVHDMGQPLFAHAAPIGYPERSTKWVSPGALIDRMNFATALSANDVKDIRVKANGLLDRGVPSDNPEAVVDHLAAKLLQRPLSPATRQTLLKTLNPEGDAKKNVDLKRAVALILGSPDFQRR